MCLNLFYPMRQLGLRQIGRHFRSSPGMLTLWCRSQARDHVHFREELEEKEVGLRGAMQSGGLRGRLRDEHRDPLERWPPHSRPFSTAPSLRKQVVSVSLVGKGEVVSLWRPCKAPKEGAQRPLEMGSQ